MISTEIKKKKPSVGQALEDALQVPGTPMAAEQMQDQEDLETKKLRFWKLAPILRGRRWEHRWEELHSLRDSGSACPAGTAPPDARQGGRQGLQFAEALAPELPRQRRVLQPRLLCLLWLQEVARGDDLLQALGAIVAEVSDQLASGVEIRPARLAPRACGRPLGQVHRLVVQHVLLPRGRTAGGLTTLVTDVALVVLSRPGEMT